jgi:hypothetical protein
MGCNTSKEAVQPVEDSNTTGATKDQQQNETKKDQVVNNAATVVPEIGEYNYTEYLIFMRQRHCWYSVAKLKLR